VREENQLKIICRIIENYRSDEPLSRHLKNFFKTHPQMGSRDRKQASGFVYNYFRIGKALNDVRMIERLTMANFLCSTHSTPLLIYCLEKFSVLNAEDIQNSFEQKIEIITTVYPYFNSGKIFPFSNHLSDAIDREKFTLSFLHQPKLWIRIRQDFREQVYAEMKEKNILFEPEENNPLSVSLINATSLEKTESYLKGYFEIQDWASQQTLHFIQPKPGEFWLDACAASGGKSLMMLDAEPSLKILATDTRLSILKNFEERFRKAGHQNFETLQVDFTSPVFGFPVPDCVLADVPCTGSGTWARSPEWLTMFDENSISEFVTLQRKIISNLAGLMKHGSSFVYITCSVFKEENEGNVEWMLKNSELALQKAGYIEGVDKDADTMYAARFIKR
jgi:16S rRNA (cytosine967-C5)-methyltransferase